MTDTLDLARTPPDLLAYLGWQGERYTLLRSHIEYYDGAGIATDAPAEVVAHWRRLGGIEAFNASEWYIAPTNQESAKALILQHHYAKSVSFLGVYIFGLFKRGETDLKGVSWWIPPAKASVDKYNAGGHKQTLALHRLVVTPDVPTNGASFLIGRSIRRIKQAGLYDYLITYADTWQGHTGTIYKATNWEYRGITEPRAVWLTEDGKQVSTLNRHKGKRASYTVEELEGMCTLVGRFPKHIYTMRLKMQVITGRKQLSLFADAA